MTLAVLCSGQGGQHAGMFGLVAREDAAPSLIAQAGAVARFDVVAASAQRRNASTTRSHSP